MALDDAALDDMALDDTTAQDTRTPEVIPAPRTADAAPAGEVLWIEAWQSTRGTRPRWEYWDVETARWTSCSPVPGPRSGG